MEDMDVSLVLKVCLNSSRNTLGVCDSVFCSYAQHIGVLKLEKRLELCLFFVNFDSARVRCTVTRNSSQLSESQLEYCGRGDQ